MIAKENILFKLISNEKELENVIHQIAKLKEQGKKLSEITKRVFGAREEELPQWNRIVHHILIVIGQKSVKGAVEYFKQKYEESKKKEKAEKKTEKTEKETEKKVEKKTSRKKTTEEKLEDAAESAVERKLLEHIRKISVEQLREVIENGLLVKEYEEQIRQEAIEQYKKLYVKERARRELLNEALFMFLSGLIDRRTLAQIVLSIAFDELFEPKLIPMSYAPGGEENGREETTS